jgi:1-acyl-sn-glycerol-3-phosphate acyltransferase
LLLFIGTPLAVVTMNRWGRSIRVGGRMLDEVLLNFWAGSMCRIFGLQIHVTGVIQPPPVLVVANHISWLDIMLLYSLAKTSFVSKAEVGDWPVIGYLAGRVGTVFHRRGSHDSANDVANAMCERLREGHRVAIFPEGGIRPGTGVKTFHARLFRAAVDTGCPVQPVMIRYLNGGQHDSAMSFAGKESFTRNFLRLLCKPATLCEVEFLTALDATGKPRRELAEASQAAVIIAYEKPV